VSRLILFPFNLYQELSLPEGDSDDMAMTENEMSRDQGKVSPTPADTITFVWLLLIDY
jgi:hypothetical protein